MPVTVHQYPVEYEGASYVIEIYAGDEITGAAVDVGVDGASVATMSALLAAAGDLGANRLAVWYGNANSVRVLEVAA